MCNHVIMICKNLKIQGAVKVYCSANLLFSQHEPNFPGLKKGIFRFMGNDQSTDKNPEYSERQ